MAVGPAPDDPRTDADGVEPVTVEARPAQVQTEAGN